METFEMSLGTETAAETIHFIQIRVCISSCGFVAVQLRPSGALRMAENSVSS